MAGLDVDVLAEKLADRLAPKLRHEGESRALFSPATLAERLELSERTVRELLATGAIESFRVGGARRIDPAAVDEYLARQRAAEGGQD